MTTTDRQTQQAQHYLQYYQYLMNRAKNMIESYILGFGFENDLLSAEKCAKTAREYRLEFERLTGIKLMGIEEE